MIGITKGDLDCIPRFLCNNCGGIIEKINLGAAVFSRDGKSGGYSEVYTVHKGECHNAIEQMLEDKNSTVKWLELRRVVNLLAVPSWPANK